MKKKVRKLEMAFRLRCFYCKKCNKRIEHFGHDPVDSKCSCCGKPVVDMPLESDHYIETYKIVTNLMK